MRAIMSLTRPEEKYWKRSAKPVGCRVNQTAAGLPTGEAHSIGVIISDIFNPFFPFIIKGIYDVCSRNNFDTILFNTDEDFKGEIRYLDLLKKKYAKGVIISSCLPGYKNHQKIFSEFTPVFSSRKPEGIDEDFILKRFHDAGDVQFLREHLIKIPDDVSVVGYNDLYW